MFRYAEDPKDEILALTRASLANANGNASRNTYVWRDAAWTLAEAERVVTLPANMPLRGMPISVKDCFDLAGSPTSCGTNFYRDLHGIATEDSWLVETLRAAGAVITGKTHLHPLAYGITGENPEFGDCLQPGNPTALTGGSSSGAAASILEGSALAAIGTDTGGSVRVPAALCGIAGYRASLGIGDWRGGAHLAQSFDTFGWLFRHLEDGPLLGSIFGLTDASATIFPKTFAVVDDSFLHDCEPEVIVSLRRCEAELEALGLTKTTVSADWWSESMEIFGPIQASEAARIHTGHYTAFEPSICQRLEWGASLTDAEINQLRQRHGEFTERMDLLLTNCQLLLLPCAPVTSLPAGADHSQTRARLLRYTSPISLAGVPAVTIPFAVNGKPSGGMQLIAAHEDDARLLAIAAQLGKQRNSAV
jgi:aspartyl-tRNA(Asn)/glutamyl-tRNA(Gln) amidotransferase subunit A